MQMGLHILSAFIQPIQVFLTSFRSSVYGSIICKKTWKRNFFLPQIVIVRFGKLILYYVWRKRIKEQWLTHSSHCLVEKCHVLKPIKICAFSDHKWVYLTASSVKNFSFVFMPIVYLQRFSGPESQKGHFDLLVGKEGGSLV